MSSLCCYSVLISSIIDASHPTRQAPRSKFQQPSPFLCIQVTAHSSNGEKSGRTVRRTEVLQEALHVQPKVHRPWEIVWVCVDPPNDLHFGEENRKGTVKSLDLILGPSSGFPVYTPQEKPHATPVLILDRFNLDPRTQPSFLLLLGQACHLQAVFTVLNYQGSSGDFYNGYHIGGVPSFESISVDCRN